MIRNVILMVVGYISLRYGLMIVVRTVVKGDCFEKKTYENT